MIDILTNMHPFLRILLIIVLAAVAHFMVRAIRRFSQLLLTMKVGNEARSETSLTRRYPRIATIITIFVSAGTNKNHRRDI